VKLSQELGTCQEEEMYANYKQSLDVLNVQTGKNLSPGTVKTRYFMLKEYFKKIVLSFRMRTLP
jgi:hypothetical protein